MESKLKKAQWIEFLLGTSGPGLNSRRSWQKFIPSMSLRLPVALLRIEWTVQKLNNVDRTHLALLDSATKKFAIWSSVRCRNVEKLCLLNTPNSEFMSHIA